MSKVLFTEVEIAARVNALADAISAQPDRPDVAAPILVGAFVFAADLLRALAKRGLSLPVEFLWLRSYGAARVTAGEVAVLVAAGEAVQGRHVLLLDGVLDHGHTLARAMELLMGAGARRITTAVAVDKRRDDALVRADQAAFVSVDRFIVGYGMDDAGLGRAYADIRAVE